jgi:hypothetical protein
LAISFGRALSALVLSATASGLAAVAPSARQAAEIDTALLESIRWHQLGPEAGTITSISIDAAFPYRVCGQDGAGLTRCSVARPDRGSARVWETLPFGAEGSVTPDPLDADVLYTSFLRRFDRRTGQGSWIGPELADQFRGSVLRSTVIFSPDGRTLLAGRRSIWRSVNGGQNWTSMSPDLVAAGGGFNQDVICALAASPIDSRVFWAGTTHGSLHVTRDAGTTWTVVTPPHVSTAVRIAGIEPSRFDPQSAYVTTSSEDATGPNIWRTRNVGAAWVNIGLSLSPGTAVHVIREDPQRRGLLFGAADGSVVFSIDDGERWQSMRSNLPNVPITDLLIRDSDIVVGTRGSGAWLLDDFSPLRQITADVLKADAFLFRPATAWRVRASSARRNVAVETALQADGVALSFLVASTGPESVSLDIIETATGDIIRRFTSDDGTRQPGDPLLSRDRGLQRVVWDLRYARPEADPDAPPGARVLPGTYQVRLSTGARSLRQSVAVRLDPRLRPAAADLLAQRTLARALDARRAELARLLAARDSGRQGSTLDRNLMQSLDELRRLTSAVNDVDARPSAAIEAAVADALVRAGTAVEAAR